MVDDEGDDGGWMMGDDGEWFEVLLVLVIRLFWAFLVTVSYRELP
jgi:hypothetical protein